jgi:hypothetical protein
VLKGAVSFFRYGNRIYVFEQDIRKIETTVKRNWNLVSGVVGRGYETFVRKGKRFCRRLDE